MSLEKNAHLEYLPNCCLDKTKIQKAYHLMIFTAEKNDAPNAVIATIAAVCIDFYKTVLC